MIFWFAQNVAKKMDNTQVAATINSPQAPIQSEKTTLEETDLSDANPTPLPTMDTDCPNCGNNTAY